MKAFNQNLILTNLIALALVACGGDSKDSKNGGDEALSIVGADTVSSDDCVPLTVTLPSAAEETLIIASSIEDGAGGVYDDVDCDSLAFFSPEIPKGSTSTKVYYSGLSIASGAVKIKVDVLTKARLEPIATASFSFTVN